MGAPAVVVGASSAAKLKACFACSRACPACSMIETFTCSAVSPNGSELVNVWARTSLNEQDFSPPTLMCCRPCLPAEAVPAIQGLGTRDAVCEECA